MKTFITGTVLGVLLFVGLLVGLSAAPAEAAPLNAVFGNVVSTTVVRIGTFLQPVEQTRVVVSDGSTITPLGSFQPISSTANTGTSSIAAPTGVNNLLVLQNVGSSTITLTDTGTLKLSGNAALANNDTIVLIFDGTNWTQIAPEGDN